MPIDSRFFLLYNKHSNTFGGKFMNITLEISPEMQGTPQAIRLTEKFGASMGEELTLRLDEAGLSLKYGEQVLKGDFTKMLNRVKGGRVNSEFLVKAAKIKNAEGELVAMDATAGLGEDSFLLAAAGFIVTMYEKNPVIYELLCDAIRRAEDNPELEPIVSRMTVINGDSIKAMQEMICSPDVILLDPMFPERQKSALVKKKLQIIQKLESPCEDEKEMLEAAMSAHPKKLIVKRPPKGAYLAGVKPNYSIEGKAVRYDCFANPKITK